MSTELIPPVRQQWWGMPAVANFSLGGLGAGFYVAAALASGLAASRALALAALLGPALVLAGFVFVAAEAGRPLRGIRVLARWRSSWMSRELALGGVFTLLALMEFVVPSPVARALAVVAAAALAVAQGFIVRRARGVVAWDVPVVPFVFLLSALVSGAGLLLLLESLGGRVPRGAGLGAALVTLVAGMVVWLAYLMWSHDREFERSTLPFRQGPLAIAIAGIGYVLPFLLLSVALAFEGPAAAVELGGALMVVGQFETKRALILTVAHLRPVTLPALRLPGVGSPRRSS